MVNQEHSSNIIRTGLIGKGIQASLTPGLHEAEGRAQGLDYVYRLIDLAKLDADVSALPRLLAMLLTMAEEDGFAGLNITHPCKQAVLPLLDQLSDEAAAIGAVNTVLFRDGRRIGHNTDWWGFAQSFRRGLPEAPRRNVMLLGAGGAGAALAYAAFQLGTEHLFIADVDLSRAESLAARCNQQQGGGRAEAVSDVGATLARSDGLIQATPIGMSVHPGSPIPGLLLLFNVTVSTEIYTPLETELLREARARGCRVLDGSGMTVYQAVRAFELFTGRSADPDRMRGHFAAMISDR